MGTQVAAYGSDAEEMLRRITWVKARSRAPNPSERLSAACLDLSYLCVYTLAPIPSFIKYLYCNGTQIRGLPPLPEGCLGLNCSDTPLEFLPALPKSLQILTCSNTLLKELPELPPDLYALHCENTRLTALPDLPVRLDIIRMEGSPLRSQRHRGESVQDYASRLRISARARRIHEELSAATMHPKRIERLVAEHGWDALDWGL